MRKHSLLLARGLATLAVLFIASPLAFAAPAKRHKPKRATAADTDSAPAAPAPDTPVVLDEAPATKPDDKPSPEPAQASAAVPSPEPTAAPESKASLSTSALPSAEPPELDSRDDAAVGRREAARLAAGRTEVAVSVSADIGRRNFTYSDALGKLLRPYRLPVAPMASFGLEAYPWASTGVPVLRDLGFRGRISRAFAVNSKTPDGTTIETSWTRFNGELRQRVLVPSQHPFELGIFAGADASYFGMSTKTKVAALLPAARTVSLRFGFDSQLLLAWRVSMLLGGAYLVTTSPGEIYDRFRSPHVAGVDADFGFALRVVPGLDARLTGRYTRYFATFKPAVGDAAVAGGALDQQLQFGLGVRYAH